MIWIFTFPLIINNNGIYEILETKYCIFPFYSITLSVILLLLLFIHYIGKKFSLASQICLPFWYALWNISYHLAQWTERSPWIPCAFLLINMYINLLELPWKILWTRWFKQNIPFFFFPKFWILRSLGLKYP